MRPVPTALKPYLHRANPRVEMVAQAVVIDAEDVIVTKSDWDACTVAPSGNVDTWEDGRVTLKASDLNAIDSTTGNSWITSLAQDISTNGRIHYAVWRPPFTLLGPNWAHNIKLRKFKAYLTRERVAGNQFTGVFKCELFALAWYGGRGSARFATVAPIYDPVYVNAITSGEGTLVAKDWPEWPLGAGVDEGLVEFDFTGRGGVPLEPIGSPVMSLDWLPGLSLLLIGRRILARVTALYGQNPTNTGWRRDSTVAEKSVTNGKLFQGQQLTTYGGRSYSDNPDAAPFYFEGAELSTEPGCPRCEFDIAQYPTGTTTVTKQLDLGQVPGAAADVVFGAIFQEPEGTTCTPRVSANGSTYYTFKDGDTAADVGIGAQQTYYLRFELTADTNRAVTPEGYELSVRDMERVDLSDLVNVKGGDFAIDPRIMRGEIRRLSLEIIRDGKRDFRDAASKLVTEHHPGDIEIELYVRAVTGLPISDPDCIPPRDEWLFLDRFRIVDTESQWGSETLSCSSVLDLVKRDIPRLKEIASQVWQRIPIQISEATAASAWDTILDEAQVPGRYKGQPPPTQLKDVNDGTPFTTSLTKTIADVTEAKREVDFIGQIMGGVTITRAGRLFWRSMWEEKEARVIFYPEDVVVHRTPRNLAERMVRYRVPYAWDEEEERFTVEAISYDSDVLTNLGIPTVGRRDSSLDDGAARYIQDTNHAERVGWQQIVAFGGGVLFPWEISSVVPHPELEPGDMVALITDRLTARDPITNREISGKQYVRAIVAGSNLWGTRLTLWVRSFADVLLFGKDAGSIGEVANVPEILSDDWLEEAGAAGLRKVTHSVTVDSETRHVLAFRRKNNWPTKDNLQTGAIDYEYFKKLMNADTGWELATDGYSATTPIDTVYDIMIPVGFDAARGERLEGSYAVTGSNDPAFEWATLTMTNPGTNCTADRRKEKVEFEVNANVTASHKVEVYYKRKWYHGWTLQTTIGDPTTTKEYEFTLDEYETDPGDWLRFWVKIELRDDATPFTLRDTRSMEEGYVFFGTVCDV